MPFKSETNPKVKLTKAQVEEIKQAIKQGVPGKELSIDYKVSAATISRIKRNKTWRGIQ